MMFDKVPKERVGILIGRRGEVKDEIERRSGVKLRVNSETGEVTLLDDDQEDPIMRLKVRDVVKAIARGFSPEHAMELLKDDRYFFLFDINDYTGKNKKHVRRVTARIIGSKGKTRSLIEDFTEATIAIYGHTVGIIGDLDGMEAAKVAVDMLLSGSEHSSVYHFLEQNHRRLKTARMGFDYIERKD